MVDDMDSWIALVTQTGVSVTIALYLMKYVTDKLTKNEAFVQEKLLETIKSSNDASAKTADAIADLCRVLRDKPCLYDLEQRDRKQRDRTVT